MVRIVEQGFTNKYDPVAMEFFAKGNLKQQLDQGVTLRTAVVHVVQLMCGLQVVLEAGIIHRDLKPADSMFRANDERAIADFGIFKRVDATT